MSQKLQHYGVNNDACATEINWALKTFVEMVRDGDEVPEHMLKFIADGVSRYLKNGQPWSKAISHHFSNQSVIGLMLAIEKRIGRGARTQIAAHWNCSASNITQMLKKPKDDPNGMIWQRYQFHKNIYLKMFEGRENVEMLNELTSMKREDES